VRRLGPLALLSPWTACDRQHASGGASDVTVMPGGPTFVSCESVAVSRLQKRNTGEVRKEPTSRNKNGEGLRPHLPAQETLGSPPENMTGSGDALRGFDIRPDTSGRGSRRPKATQGSITFRASICDRVPTAPHETVPRCRHRQGDRRVPLPSSEREQWDGAPSREACAIGEVANRGRFPSPGLHVSLP
jgi:hypothetical protein